MKRVCVIGMGYVGLTLGVALADAGYYVAGIENNPRTLASLRAGKPDVYEPGLAERYGDLLSQGKIALYEKPDREASVYVITVGTPLGSDGHTQMKAIENVASSIKEVLKEGDLVILRSTVCVGTTTGLVKPVLDEKGVAYSLAMCPERTIEGSAIEELHSLPQIVGGIDGCSSETAASFFAPLGCEIVMVSSPEAAELAKLVSNTQRDVRFAYANEIALIAEDFLLDANEVINAANHNYSRSNVARPGPVAGPCLEKDAYILAESIGNGQTAPELIMTARKLNESLAERAVRQMVRRMEESGKKPRKIAIMGLAFKGEPETGDLRGSMAIHLKRHINRYFPNAAVSGFDPVASAEECMRWDMPYAKTPGEALDGADLVFMQTNHKHFRTQEFAKIMAAHAPDCLVYDFWNVLKETSYGERRQIAGLGRPGKQDYSGKQASGW